MHQKWKDKKKVPNEFNSLVFDFRFAMFYFYLFFERGQNPLQLKNQNKTNRRVFNNERERYAPLISMAKHALNLCIIWRWNIFNDNDNNNGDGGTAAANRTAVSA